LIDGVFVGGYVMVRIEPYAARNRHPAAIYHLQ
jgi:hypothetical protein